MRHDPDFSSRHPVTPMGPCAFFGATLVLRRLWARQRSAKSSGSFFNTL
jgi:hypothetical protein